MIPRDYKHSRTSQRKPLPAWLWLLTGLVLGLAVAFLVYLNAQKNAKNIQQHSETEISAKSASNATGSKPTQQSTTSAKQRFDFYTLLPELEVEVPQEAQAPKQSLAPLQSSPDKNREATSPKAQHTTDSYFLQAGSFRKLQEADSLKAKLALIGIESTIESIEVNTNTWHRVRIGPYRNRSQINQIRAQLSKNHIETFLLTAKEKE